VVGRRETVLDQQGDVVDDDRVRLRGRHQLPGAGADQGVHDRVEPAPRLVVGERLRGEHGPVERTVRGQDLRTELRHQPGEPLGPGLDHLTGDPVGVHQHGTVLGQPVRHGRLPGPDPTRQPHAQHADHPSHGRPGPSGDTSGQACAICVTSGKMS
jgi:hypothetical protein